MFKKEEQKVDWKRGLKKGIPIALGYFPVSFTFGLFAVEGGFPAWLAVLISLSNVTSAGQFAGTKLIFVDAGYMEIVLTTIIINLRYMLMSLSLSQKIQPKMERWQRMVISFGITDETFSHSRLDYRNCNGSMSFGSITGTGNGGYGDCAVLHVYCNYCSAGKERKKHIVSYITFYYDYLSATICAIVFFCIRRFSGDTCYDNCGSIWCMG